MSGYNVLSSEQYCAFTGIVHSFEASGGSANSKLFSFTINDGGTIVRPCALRFETPDAMFAAMATIIVAAFYAKAKIQVISYTKIGDIYLVNLLRNT